MEKAKRVAIDEKVFVQTWMEVHKANGNLNDVATKIGCSYAGARNKADRLIESGVELPELKKGRRGRKVAVDALNADIASEMAIA